VHDTKNRPEVGIMNSSRAGATTRTTEQRAARSAAVRSKAVRVGAVRAVGVRSKAVRRSWIVLCAVAAVVLGPAAATASALEQADKAPLHHAVRVDQAQAYLPADSTRRRPAA
jgi:hypothetical protein